MPDYTEGPTVGHTPTKSDIEVVRALARSISQARAILFNTLVQMEQRPKPWTDRDKKLRFKVAKTVGILKDAWREIPSGIQSEALRAPHTEAD